MANPHVVCFLEDLMHDQMVSALIRRIAREEGIPDGAVQIQTLNATGGVPAALRQLEAFVGGFVAGELGRPDIVVVALDSDCDAAGRRGQLEQLLAGVLGRTCVVLCIPDPYIERWYLLDLGALRAALGLGPPGEFARTCDKSFYKTTLVSVIEASGHQALVGGYEYADLIVEHMDLYRAGVSDSGFASFVEDLRNCLREVQRTSAA